MMKLATTRRILIICIVFIFVFVGFGIFVRTHYLVPILMYHSIDGPEGGSPDKMVRLAPRNFEKQMRFLKVNHYNVISLEHYAQAVRTKEKLPRNSVVITFDDGYEDNYLNAYPILKRYGFPATIFIITHKIGSFDYLTLQQLREMSDSGLVTFGSHTQNHCYLPNVHDKAILRQELVGSKKELESMLGKPATSFCYPIGGYSDEIRAVVQEAGYSIATAISPGNHSAHGDLLMLKRIKITDKAGNPFIFWYENSGFYKYFKELTAMLSSNKKRYIPPSGISYDATE